MYNEVIKNRYLETVDNLYTKESYLSVFKRIAKYESKFNKDIYEMTQCELMEFINEFTIIRGGISARSGQIYSLESYVRWCLDNNIDNSNDNIFKINLDPTEKIKNVMFKNPEQLDATLNAIFKPIDKNTIDNVYRCAIWLLYSGIKKNDLEYITEDNIDIAGMTINYNSKTYKLYPESIESVKSCINLKSFNIIHPSYKDRYGTDERFVGKSILRTTTGDLKFNSLQQLINRKIKAAENNGVYVKKIKIDKIRLSGIFYRAYSYEKQGMDIDFTSIVTVDMEGKEYKETKRNTMRSIILDKSREYKADYERWKNALYQ